jgi:hypothetical protein
MPKKNAAGGNRHKKMASKSFKEPRQNKMRYAQPGESYARILKVFGQGMVDVLCNDNVVRLCIIRKKFKGRNKRDNNCSIDTMVLVGIREWEVIAIKKKSKVDLLYTYDKNQIPELKLAKGFNKSILPEFVNEEDNMDSFQYDRTSSTQQELSIENKNITQENKTIEKNEKYKKFEDFDWDEI